MGPSHFTSLVILCFLGACLLLGFYFGGFSGFTFYSECSRQRRGMGVSRRGGGLEGDGARHNLTVQSRYSIDPYQLLGPVPWQDLAQKMRDDFTRNGSILSASWFLSDGVQEKVWSKGMIDELVSYADAREPFALGPEVNDMFLAALKAYPVKRKSVLVIGGGTPWVEALCISHAAARITVVGYKHPLVQDGRITAISRRELGESHELYDAIFCYNSIHSEGLGRYGDPVNPWADFQHMRELRGLLQPGGKMFFGVNLGNDTVHFNAHRIYGKMLFPQLIRGWKVETMFGGTSPVQFYDLVPLKYAQPLLVLSVAEDEG